MLAATTCFQNLPFELAGIEAVMEEAEATACRP